MVTEMRLDAWLDIACLFRTRSEAQRACKAGRVSVNGTPAKPNRLLRGGEELVIARPFGREQRIRVKALADRHVSKADARQLYHDLTPPPTPEELEARRLERMFRSPAPLRAPDKRDRRLLRRLKGKA